MIEKLSRAEWVALSEQVAGQLAPVFERGAASLGPNGQKMVPRALKKVSVSSGRSVNDLGTIVALLHVAGAHAEVVECAEVFTAVPFTGDWNIYASIPQVFALAVRSLQPSGPDASRFVERLTFGERGGELGPPLLTPQLTNRLDGLLFRDNARDDHSQGGASVHIHNVCIDVEELVLMWALGGSRSWPRTRIDAELEVSARALRGLKAIP